MTNALVVADDLTGAMDTGHGFAARGRSVTVRLAGPGASADAHVDPSTAPDVLAVDTDTRDRSAEVAAEAVARAVDATPAPLVYKKVDSTLRGNVVAEVDAAMTAMDDDLAVVAPAFPATGRTTEDGQHRVDGRPLAEAGYGVGESDLRALLAASQYPVRHVDRETVTEGADAVRDALSAAAGDGPVLITCDATTEDHLRAIAAGAAALDATALYVGSGGLSKHVEVPGAVPDGAVGETRPDHGGAGVLGVVGSVNERTLTQLGAVPDDVVVCLDPAAAVRDPTAAGRGVVSTLQSLLAEAGRAVVTAATGPADVEAAETAARAADCDVEPGERVSTALTVAAAATLDERAVAGLVLTGGDVARAVLDALGADELALTGEAVGEGVPVSRVLTGRAAGTRLVTKAGGFGEERVILNCLDALSRD